MWQISLRRKRQRGTVSCPFFGLESETMQKTEEWETRKNLRLALAQALYEDKQMVAYFIGMASLEYDEQERRFDMKMAA
jgi:hypothetical protein